MNKTNLKILKKNTEGKIDFHFGGYGTKNMHCEVDGVSHKCYQLPLDVLIRLIANQARVKDCDANKVTEMADDLAAVGQLYPICVTPSGEIIFGHTRFRASSQVFDNNESIPHIKDDHIWVRVFRGNEVQKIVLGLKENANKRPQSPATPEDVVFNIKKLISAKAFDEKDKEFKDLNDEDQKEKIKEFVKKEIPSWGGRKFRGLWGKLRKSIPDIQKKFRTWDKNEQCEYFFSHNSYEITRDQWKKKQESQGKSGKDIKEVFESGEIFDTKNHGKVCVWFLNGKGETTGGTWKSSTHEKCSSNKADKVVVVAAINWSNDQGIESIRDTIIESFKSWNKILFDKNGNNTPSVHKICFVPQRESEQKLILKGEYARSKNFVEK